MKNGKKADIILLDLNNELTNPHGNIFSDIVYNAKGSNVTHTIVNGVVLMEDREILKADKYMIFEKCEEIINRIS